MTDKTDTSKTGATAIRVRVEYDAPVASEDCEPRDFLRCETEEEANAIVADWAEKSAMFEAIPNADDIARLWAAVQALRGRGE